jgi:DNA-directed RNA polymerase specialized sigma24 family protein
MTEQEQEGFSLFRRAISGRDMQAWSEIHQRYRPLLIAWAYRSGVHLHTYETCEDIADQAFARAWAALSPDRFSEFATLAQLLGYLRTCVSSTAIDCMRSEQSLQRIRNANNQYNTPSSPEHIVIEDLSRNELWQRVLAFANQETERIILVESFVYSLPPRTIQERYPQLFACVNDIYTIKRNLFAKLQRHRRELFADDLVLA